MSLKDRILDKLLITGTAMKLDLDALAHMDVQAYLNDNSEAAPYFKEGDYFAWLEKEDCMTVIPAEEFEANFHFLAPESEEPNVMTAFRQNNLFKL